LLLALSSLWYYKTCKLVTGTKKLAKGPSWVSTSVWANENEIFFTQKKKILFVPSFSWLNVSLREIYWEIYAFLQGNGEDVSGGFGVVWCPIVGSLAMVVDICCGLPDWVSDDLVGAVACYHVRRVNKQKAIVQL
jgi:hypothetical protein